MTDDMQRAREFLADATAKRGRAWEVQAGNIRRGDYDDTAQMEAIAAALRSAPDGFVLVPVEPTQEMIDAALGNHWWHRGDELRTHYRRMLDARPQG